MHESQVDEDYIEDDFNLSGLSGLVRSNARARHGARPLCCGGAPCNAGGGGAAGQAALLPKDAHPPPRLVRARLGRGLIPAPPLYPPGPLL